MAQKHGSSEPTTMHQNAELDFVADSCAHQKPTANNHLQVLRLKTPSKKKYKHVLSGNRRYLADNISGGTASVSFCARAQLARLNKAVAMTTRRDRFAQRAI